MKHLAHIVKETHLRAAMHLRRQGHSKEEIRKILQEHRATAVTSFDTFMSVQARLPLAKKIEFADRQVEVLEENIATLAAKKKAVETIKKIGELRARIVQIRRFEAEAKARLGTR